MIRVLVIGSGIAGLTAARHAAAAGHEVVVATKHRADTGCTTHAQGGIAGAVFADDSVEAHVRDTLAAGAGECDPEAVRVLCAEGPDRIRELAVIGVEFDRADDGSWARGLEAAHSSARVVHAGGDATGARIETALIAAARRAGVTITEDACLLDLIVREGRVRGARFCSSLDVAAVFEIKADAVVLATGGFGALYPLTSNPGSATGDGIAVAWRAGAAVADLEFVQFHPTVLAVGEPFLVSEAVRGEGAVLRDASGHRFMPEFDARAELAPRDVVARACAAVMARQGGAPVVLDATMFTDAELARRFPSIDAAVRERGLDWSREPIPVRPGAHFAMGGVATDLAGRTSLPGLYAVGEVACTGVHGANRLASNSLLEGAVFGARVAAVMGEDAVSSRWQPQLRRPVLQFVEGEADALFESQPFSRQALQQLMWREVGLLRDGAGLKRAAAQLAAWREELGHTALRVPQGTDATEDRHLLDVATLATASALQREDSVGAHFRTDAPINQFIHHHTEEFACSS